MYFLSKFKQFTCFTEEEKKQESQILITQSSTQSITMHHITNDIVSKVEAYMVIYVVNL